MAFRISLALKHLCVTTDYYGLLQHMHLVVVISEDCSWDTTYQGIEEEIGKGQAHVGKMDAILLIADSHLGTIVGSRDATQMTAGKKVLLIRCLIKEDC